MKPSELKIGNLVKLTEQARKDLFDNSDIPTKTDVFPVVMIDTVFVNLFIESQEIEFCYGDIEPIPLTEEIMLKLGGKKDKEGQVFIHLDERCDVRLYLLNGFIQKCKHDYCPLSNYNHIKYVHLLQNLFSIETYQELTLTK